MVLEKEKFPRFQIGESLLPSTIHGVCRLTGVLDEVTRAGFTLKRGGTQRWGAVSTPAASAIFANHLLMVSGFHDCPACPVSGEDEPVLIEFDASRDRRLTAVLFVVGEQLKGARVEGQAALAVGLGLLDPPLPLPDHVGAADEQVCSTAAASSRTASSGVGGSSCPPVTSGGVAARAEFSPSHFHRTP